MEEKDLYGQPNWPGHNAWFCLVDLYFTTDTIFFFWEQFPFHKKGQALKSKEIALDRTIQTNTTRETKNTSLTALYQQNRQETD